MEGDQYKHGIDWRCIRAGYYQSYDHKFIAKRENSRRWSLHRRRSGAAGIWEQDYALMGDRYPSLDKASEAAANSHRTRARRKS